MLIIRHFENYFLTADYIILQPFNFKKFNNIGFIF
mgnify:FL=1